MPQPIPFPQPHRRSSTIRIQQLSAAKTVSTADSISIATAAKQKDDPENGIASIIVVCVSTSIVFASASTVCSCYITHVFIPPELIYTS